MTLITGLAYFLMCPHSPPPHGSIYCTNGAGARLASKASGRVCARLLNRAGYMTDDEHKVVLDQIDRSPLPDSNDIPAAFYPPPSTRQDEPIPNLQDGETGVVMLNAGIDKPLEALLSYTNADVDQAMAEKAGLTKLN